MAKSELRTKIALLRATSGISARGFAALSGRSFHTQKALESGRLALSESLALTIAKKTGASLTWLLSDAMTGPPVGANGKELTQRDIESHIGRNILHLEFKEIESRKGVMVHLFEEIVKNALKRSDFHLFVFRATEFLNRLAEEFPAPSKAAGSSKSRP